MDDLAVPQHHRTGAHRARRHPVLVGLLTVGAVAVASAVLLWALLAFDVLGVGDDLLEAGGGDPAPSIEATVPSGAAPDPQASEAEPVQPSPEASADRALRLAVLNATGTSGLASAAAEALGASGWQVDEVGNYDGDDIPTAVLYPEDSGDPQAAAVASATATAVAADLGIGAVGASPDVDRVTVVVGPDYDP